MTNPLPANVHLLTLEQWAENEILLRLEHQFELNEDKAYSKPVTVSLKVRKKKLKWQLYRNLIYVCDLIKRGMSWMPEILILSYRLWAVTNSYVLHCFLRGYCTSGPYFARLRAFSQKIKHLWTKYPMDLLRNIPRNSKITVLLQ